MTQVEIQIIKKWVDDKYHKPAKLFLFMFIVMSFMMVLFEEEPNLSFGAAILSSLMLLSFAIFIYKGVAKTDAFKSIQSDEISFEKAIKNLNLLPDDY